MHIFPGLRAVLFPDASWSIRHRATAAIAQFNKHPEQKRSAAIAKSLEDVQAYYNKRGGDKYLQKLEDKHASAKQELKQQEFKVRTFGRSRSAEATRHEGQERAVLSSRRSDLAKLARKLSSIKKVAAVKTQLEQCLSSNTQDASSRNGTRYQIVASSLNR